MLWSVQHKGYRGCYINDLSHNTHNTNGPPIKFLKFGFCFDLIMILANLNIKSIISYTTNLTMGSKSSLLFGLTQTFWLYLKTSTTYFESDRSVRNHNGTDYIIADKFLFHDENWLNLINFFSIADICSL